MRIKNRLLSGMLTSAKELSHAIGTHIEDGEILKNTIRLE